MDRARTMRTFGRRGRELALAGPFLGTLLLRSQDRAERIDRALRARAFAGSFPALRPHRFGAGAAAFLAALGGGLRPLPARERPRGARPPPHGRRVSHHLVEADGLRHVWPDGTVALDGVTFRITHGEAVGDRRRERRREVDAPPPPLRARSSRARDASAWATCP